MSSITVAVLGTGTMGRALGMGMLRAGVVTAEGISGTVKHAREADEVRSLVDFAVDTDNAAAVRRASVVLICTKPHGAAQVLSDLADEGALEHDPLIISIAAGVSIAALEHAAGCPVRVIRAMPNTPCLIGEGMVVLSAGSKASEGDLDVAETIFTPLARVLRLDEEHMNTVTGLSGSGPAFVYVIIEALAEGGVMMGLPRKVATELAAQTVKGAARMVLDTGRHPASLKDDVTTPAGCTISALLSLEDGRLRSVLARGVQEAARSAAGLGGEKS
ncbi:MAG: pyrroline-5-carboxylate reductase [Proteobacteria bacterium]|nr:pyrroline-5-carboxylate reductase [Pseudomonadota bacterium]